MAWYPFVLKLLGLTAAGSIAIVGVLLIRLPLKKAPRWISYALWCVVLVRLLVPFSLETPHGVVPRQAQKLQETVYYDYYDRVTPAAAADAAQRTVGDTLNGGMGTVYIHLTAENTPESNTLPAAAVYHRQVWPLVLTAVWPIGAAAMLLYALVSYLRLRRKLVGAVKLENNVYLADCIPSPFVLGLLRPKIYLPSTLSPEESDYILRHEQTHIRRLDHVTRFLAFAALTLHWFNPLAWLAFALSAKDMELSCDEAVLKHTDADIRADYSQSLLNISAGRRLLPGTPLAFGEGNVKGRIQNVLRYRKTPVRVVAVGLCLAILLGGCLLTNRAEMDDDALLKYFNEKYFANTGDAMQDKTRWFRNHFTTSYYRTPQTIDCKALFYDGGPGVEDFYEYDADKTDYASPEEQAYFDEYGPICPIHKTTTGQIDAAILEYTGVSMESVYHRGIDRFAHINGSLYWANGDTNCGPLEFYALEREGDLIHLSYRLTDTGYDVLTLREVQDSYLFQSNLRYYFDETPQQLQNYLGTEYTDVKIFPATFTRDPRWEADDDLIGFTAKRNDAPYIGYAVVRRGTNGEIRIADAKTFGNPEHDPVTDVEYGDVACGRALERNTFFVCFSNDRSLAHVRVTASGEDYWEQDVSAPLILAVPLIDILPDYHVYFTDADGELITERHMTWSDVAYRQELAYFAANAQNRFE